MIEVCKNLVIGIFWVLAALFAFTVLAGVLKGFIRGIRDSIRRDGEK